MRRKKVTVQDQTAEIVNAGYELVDASLIFVHPKNPRKGNVGAIWDSIETNGFFGALVVQKSTGYVLAGNHTLKAGLEHGMEQIPVIWVDVDDDRALKIMLAANKTADDSTYDNAILSELLADISNRCDLSGTGYSDKELDKLIETLVPKDEKTKDDEPELIASWAIFVDCENEEQQTELLERFMGEGLSCRALTS